MNRIVISPLVSSSEQGCRTELTGYLLASTVYRTMPAGIDTPREFTTKFGFVAQMAMETSLRVFLICEKKENQSKVPSP
jgi:hypothetical protein